MYLFIFISPCHLENGYYPVDFIPSCGNDWFDYRAIEKPVIRIRGLLSHCCFKLIKLKSFHLFCHCAFLTASLVYVSRNSWMDNNSNDNSNNYDGDNNNRKKVSRTVEALGQLSRTEWDSCVGGRFESPWKHLKSGKTWTMMSLAKKGVCLFSWIYSGKNAYALFGQVHHCRHFEAFHVLSRRFESTSWNLFPAIFPCFEILFAAFLQYIFGRELSFITLQVCELQWPWTLFFNSLLCVGAGLAVEDSLAGIPALGLKFQCSWQGTPNLIFNNKLKELKRVPSLLLWKMWFAF